MPSLPRLGLPTLAIAVAAGVWIGEHAGPLARTPTPWLWLVAALAAAPGAARLRAVAGAAALGAAVGALASAPAPRAPAGTAVDDAEPDQVVGVVRGPTTRLADRWLATVVTDDEVAIAVTARAALAPGDRVRVLGRLRTPRGYDNPGEPDRAAMARVRGVGLELTATEVERLAASGGWPWRWADRVRWRWSAAIADVAPARPAAAAIVRGAVVGDRGDIDAATNARWRAAGVFHVLSVSGLHLAVVALFGFAACKRTIAALGAMRGRPPAALAALPALAVAAAYTAITGAEIATARALIVVGVLVVGEAIGRAARIGDALGAAAIAILVARPASLHDPSFQLSFVAAGVLAAIPRRPVAVTPGGRGRRAARAVVRGVVASAWVTAATAPLTAAAFGQIAWGGIVGNLVVTPVVELAVIPATLVGLALGAVSGPLGAVVIAAAVAITALADRVVAGLAAVTPVIAVDPPSTAELAVWTALWLVPFVAWRGGIRRRRAAAVVAALVVAAAGLRWQRVRALAHPDALVVTFLDVGQGDAAVIEAPGGQTWLVDAGGSPGAPGDAASAPGAAVARFLAARHRDRLELVVISHPHPDHYLGLLALAGRVRIDTVLVAVDPAPADGAREAGAGGDPGLPAVLDRLRAAGARVIAPPLGVVASSGDARLEVLAPRYRPSGAPVVAAGDPVRSVNDNSLVVAAELAGRRVLFLGDLEAEGEEALVDAGDAAADVVKVAHHGSATSSTPALVAATGARFAVISCGRANRFGFPRPRTVARWAAAGARVLAIDEVGAVTVRVDRAGHVAVTARRLDGGAPGAL